MTRCSATHGNTVALRLWGLGSTVRLDGIFASLRDGWIESARKVGVDGQAAMQAWQSEIDTAHDLETIAPLVTTQ